MHQNGKVRGRRSLQGENGASLQKECACYPFTKSGAWVHWPCCARGFLHAIVLKLCMELRQCTIAWVSSFLFSLSFSRLSRTGPLAGLPVMLPERAGFAHQGFVAAQALDEGNGVEALTGAGLQLVIKAHIAVFEGFGEVIVVIVRAEQSRQFAVVRGGVCRYRGSVPIGRGVPFPVRMRRIQS